MTTSTTTTAKVTTAEARARLGRRLQMVRGLYWGWGSNGDPLAELLCGHSQTNRQLPAGPQEPRMIRSRTETWLVNGHDVAREALENPSLQRVLGRVPEWARAADVPAASWAGPFLSLHAAAWDEPAPTSDGPAQRIEAALEGRNGRLDLVRDVAWPAAVAGLSIPDADKTAVWALRVALDAQLSPQTLDTTTAALEALTTVNDPSRGVAVALLANTIANAVLLTAEDEAWSQAVVADASAARACVSETLRLTPTQHLERRTATGSVELGGQQVAEGDEVIVAIAASNRDPLVFGDADAFVPARVESDLTLSAQTGLTRSALDSTIHELAATALPCILRPGLSVVGPLLRRHRSPVLRALDTCPIERREN